MSAERFRRDSHTPPHAGYRLLVLRGGRADTFIMPANGEVRVGRSAGCEVAISDERLAPMHLALSTTPDLTVRVLFNDDGSENTITVGSRLVHSGEVVRVSPGVVISVGGATLVVQMSRTSTRLRLVRSHNYFEARIEDECARAEATHGEFSVLRIRCQPGAVAKLEHSFGQWLRPMDVVALYAPNEYEVLLVDTPGDAAEIVSRQFVKQLGADQIEVATRSFPEFRTPETLVPRLVAETDEEGPDAVAAMTAMDRLKPILDLVAGSSISVLLLGETGVGKDVAANAIHYRSTRAGQPLVCVNCGAFSESLLDSELFGHERGAFTGSAGMKVGLIESADGGTLFLDEAGEMPPSLQTKLLRVLEQRQVMRIGSVRPRNIDVRFIAATNRDLEEEVARGAFRRDLYYRLAGTTIQIPPLRERRAEIPKLAELFVEQWCMRESIPRRPKITRDAMKWLLEYAWPGNVRELKNVIDRAVLLCRDGNIGLEHLPTEKMSRSLPTVVSHALPAHHRVISEVTPTRVPFDGSRRDSRPPPEPPRSVSVSLTHEGAELLGPMLRPSHPPSVPPSASEPDDEPPLGSVAEERARVIDALERCAWNQTQAAKLLGVSRRTLIKRLELFALPRPRKNLT